MLTMPSVRFTVNIVGNIILHSKSTDLSVSILNITNRKTLDCITKLALDKHR